MALAEVILRHGRRVKHRTKGTRDLGPSEQAPAQQPQEVPGMPEGATAYSENAGSPNEQNMPVAMSGMESQLQAGSGGVDLRYIAQRAAAYLRTVKKESGAEAMYSELQTLQVNNPTLYQLVVQLIDNTGSKENPMDAAQNPNPNPQADASRQV